MIREEYPRRRLTEACYSLLTIAIGFVSCSIVIILLYYTCQATVGNISYCSLWTHIPGILALFLTLYYAAGLCGALPISECFRMNWLPPPFILYRLESWRNLRENLCRLFKFNQKEYEVLESCPEMFPPQEENNERDYDCSSTLTFLEEPQNIQISNTDTPKQCIARSNRVERYGNVENASSYEDNSIFFDSPIAGQFVPMVEGKSPKPRYIPDFSISTSGSVGKSLSGDAPSDELCEVPKTLNDRFKAVPGLCYETDTLPRTPKVKLPLTSHPRIPWSEIKNGSDISSEAMVLHKNNLMREKQEISEYEMRQKVEETSCFTKDSDRNQVTGSDEFNSLANHPLRIPQIPNRTKSGFRDRTITAPRSMPKLGKMKAKIRKSSCSPTRRYRPYTIEDMNPESGDDSVAIKEDKCCETSSEIQTKIEHTQKASMKSDPVFQAGASTSRQRIDFFNDTVNSNMSSEPSTSRQNINVFPSKMSDSNIDTETLASGQSIDVFPSNTSDSNISGEASTSRQDIDAFPRKISDSNVDAETSASRQNIDDLTS